MNPCKNIQRSFVDALYGEFDEQEQKNFKNHLDSCERCRKSFKRMQRTLHVMSNRQRTEPDPAFWDGYWEKLEQRMEKRPQDAPSTKAGGTKWMPWIYRAAAVILLIGAGVILGRLSRTGTVTEQPVAKAPVIGTSVQQAKLQQRTQDFLGRSEILLLGIVHMDASRDPAAIDIPRQKRISGDLVQEASFLKKELSDSKDRRLEKLVGDLELILVQIANLEEKEDLPEIELVKNGVDRKGLLMKINVEQMRSHPSHGNSNSASGKSGI